MYYGPTMCKYSVKKRELEKQNFLYFCINKEVGHISERRGKQYIRRNTEM